MGGSMLKYIDRARRKNDPSLDGLLFGRAMEDSMPYRGYRLPPLREEEYEELTETVFDGGVETFEINNPEERAKLCEIFERSLNGWANIYKMREKIVTQKDGSVRVFVYCVWGLPYKELNRQRAELLGPIIPN